MDDLGINPTVDAIVTVNQIVAASVYHQIIILDGMKYRAFLPLLLVTHILIGQPANSIIGKITDAGTDAVIPNASIFITNTSKGTITNITGEFELQNVPVGSYDLVMSCIGYETQVYSYKASQLPLRLLVKMQPKATELQNVVVEPYEKDGWEKWGDFFLQHFIGTTSLSKDCRILNYKTLHFRNSKKRNELSVTAEEPLIIENKALGYKVQYQLEGFQYKFNENTMFYFGYTLFNELNKKGPKTRQLKNRREAFLGSIQHFMSSLYHNRLAEEGFEVKRLFKSPNLEKERIKQIFRNSLGNANRSKDSASYYDRVLRQPDMLETYGKKMLTADSLVAVADSSTKTLFFTDYLYVVYKNEKEEPAYLQYTHEARAPFHQRSVIFLLNNQALLIDKAGNYSMPQDFMSYGYWGWSEKIASLLPLDYK